MEVRPGYKRTEVGVIPEGWEEKSFGHLFEFRNGVNADKASYGQGVPFINVLEPITYSHIYGPEITGQVTLRESVLVSYAVRRGDVLFNRTSETQEEVGLAATYLGTERVVFGGFVIRGRPKDQSLDPIYSGYALRAQAIRSQIIPMGQGAIRANIGQHNLRLVVAHVPPPPEQRAIGSALRDVGALVESLEGLIAKKRDLKQAAMQQLLTGQTRLPEFDGRSSRFHDSDFGEFPSDWKLMSLSQVSAFITKGSTPTTYGFQWVNSGVPFLRSECVSERGLDLSESMFISQAAHRQLRRSEVEAGDILITITGNVGRVIFLGDGFPSSNINQHIARIRIVDEQTSASFVYHFLSQPAARKYYSQITTGQAYPQLSLTQVRDTLLPMPPHKEQCAIAAVLTDMDAELVALEQRLAKTLNLKRAMMQELLTGKIRLISPEARDA